MGPLAAANGHDAPRLSDKLLPGLAAMIDDVVVGLEDAVRQPVVAHELPDILDRVFMMTLHCGFLLWRSQGSQARHAGNRPLQGGP